MRIESGTTNDRRLRLLLFLVMCLVFALWFGYDGFRGYPAGNLEKALENMPVKPPNPRINPRAIKQDLEEKITEGMTIEELTASFGDPLLIEPLRFEYLGPEWAVTVSLDQGRVTEVARRSIEPENRPERPNLRVTPATIERVEAGFTESQLRQVLSEPTEVLPETHWYVGPAAFAKIPIEVGKVAGGIHKPEIGETEHSESDILVQKVLALILMHLGFIVIAKFVGALRMRIVVDDTGLAINRKRVAFDAMRGLRIDAYRDKGWVFLDYEKNDAVRSIKLDSYDITRFDELVGAICERTGFAPPTASPAEPSDGEPISPPSPGDDPDADEG